ncbi:MAG: NfeD family protein [Phycisphaerae bacterium]
MIIDTLILILILVAASLALAIIEICTPAFGILGALSLIAMIVAIWLVYTINGLAGVVATGAAVVAYPAFLIVAMKKLPQTAFGRRLFLAAKPAEAGEGTPDAPSLKELIGRETETITVLRPAGMVRIDGRRVPAQAEHGMIEKGVKVVITAATGTDLIVREKEE